MAFYLPIAVAVCCILLVVWKILGKESFDKANAASDGLLGNLTDRAAKLLPHIDSLGLPLLKPLLLAVSTGKTSTLPTILNGVFDQLDDGPQRSQILENLWNKHLERRLEDPVKRQALVDRLVKAGVLPAPAPAAAATDSTE